MAHNKLSPDDEYLSPTEIVCRLKKEFSFVQTSKVKGKESIQARIACLQQLKAAGKNPSGTSMENQIAFLEERIDFAIDVTIADDPQSKGVLTATLVPDETVFFGYTSRTHEEACSPLVQRCAKVLGYGIVE